MPAARSAGAEPVDRVRARTARRGIVSEITTSASAADREVDEEDPAPARVVDDEAADRRADDRRRREDGADQPLPAAAVARRDDRPDHREREREEAARADPLDRAEDDSSVMFCASPHSAEPTRKIEIETSSSGRRPYTSPSRP